MNKKSSRFLLSSLALILAACSSGGGGSTVTESASSTVSETTTITTGNNATPAPTLPESATVTPGNTTTSTPAPTLPESSSVTTGNTTTPAPTLPATEAGNGSQSTTTGTPSSTPTPSTPNTGNNVISPPKPTLDQADKYRVRPIAKELAPQINQVIENTNKLRAEKGLSPLVYDEKLSAYAQRRAEEIVGRFEHTLPDSNLKVISEVNAGENIAAGETNASATVLQWRNSPGHYANIITPHYQKIGVGIVYVPGSEYGYYWVQLFGNEGTESHYYFDYSLVNDLAGVTTKIQQIQPATQWLSVDGVDIPIHHVTGNGTWHNIANASHNGMVNGYANTRFGVLRAGTGDYTAFYQGNNTQYENMPQTGSAVYKGLAVISDAKNVNTNVEANVNANFSTKTLNATLLENKVKVMDINAKIRGTTFYSPEGAAVATQGSFFGTNADEVGGVFYEKSTAKRGAFAAKKQ